ncbi:VOC family protein [Schleiferiaceae bacterium]|nr:VOC family protein [Schleiferiaceae bacterium]
MRIHHLGIACKDIRKQLVEFKKFHKVIWESEIVEDLRQNAQLCMVKTDFGLDFEFVSGTVVSGIVKKGISYYHTCYEVENLDGVLADFVSRGAILVSKPKQAVLFNNRRVAFLYMPYGLIELLEE